MRHRRRGFTLIELLIGLLISTMILGAAAGVFVTATQSWERGNRRYKTLQAARATSDLLERHLRSAMPPGNNANWIFWGEDLSGDSAAGCRLSFLSSSPGRFPKSGPATEAVEIEFSFDPSLGGGLTMRIDSTPDEFPSDGGYELTLSSRVRSFEALFYDGVEWTTEWYESDLPAAIEFTIGFDDEEAAAAAAEDSEGEDALTGAEQTGAGGETAKTEAPPVFEATRLVTLPLGKTAAGRRNRGLRSTSPVLPSARTAPPR